MIRRDRDHPGRPLQVTRVGIVILVVLIGFLAGITLPEGNYDQVQIVGAMLAAGAPFARNNGHRAPQPPVRPRGAALAGMGS